MREEQKNISLDAYEEGAVIEGLNKIRTEQLERGESAGFVSDVILKIIRTPTKKVKIGAPAKSGTSWGKEEQRSGADTRQKAGAAERSLRRRDEAR